MSDRTWGDIQKSERGTAPAGRAYYGRFTNMEGTHHVFAKSLEQAVAKLREVEAGLVQWGRELTAVYQPDDRGDLVALVSFENGKDIFI